MKYQGKISNWNDAKGFGFVQPNGGGQRAFVHISAFTRRSKRPADNDIIVYELTQQADGKAKAVNVMFVADYKSRNTANHSPSRSSESSKAAIVFTGLFCVVFIAVTLLNILPRPLLFLYTGASLLAFLMYAWDKSAAQNNRWRTPEAHLQLVALIGGWPGAYVAQRTLRHKSSKTSFKVAFWCSVALNITALGYLFTESGQSLVNTVF